MQDFTQLRVWQKAHALTLDIYQITAHIPSDEKFGLTSQISRSCISIESNLAEDCGRDSDREFARFINISMGSSFELRCQLIIAKDLKYITSPDFELCESKILEINRMLGSFLKKLKA